MSKSKNVLVTGTNSGFGYLIVQNLIKQGYTVFATMRNTAKKAKQVKELEAFAKKENAKLHLLELDVTGDESVDQAIQKAIRLEGKIDVVVNNAGIGCGVGEYCETVSMEQFQNSFDVNVFGVQRVIRSILPSMRKEKSGLIINISSVMGRIVLPFAATYTATKYALEGLSESYRYELSGSGVDVVIVEPGGFGGTSFWSNMENSVDSERLESYGNLADLPKQKFWGSMEKMLHGDNAPNPQDVADALLKLIKTPKGERPLRVVVDPMTGGEAPNSINETTDQIQNQVLSSLDMSELLTVSNS